MTLIDDFMDISIIESWQLQLDLEPVSLHVTLTNSYETNRLIAEEKSITLKTDLENELPMVNIDSALEYINKAKLTKEILLEEIDKKLGLTE